MAGDLGRLDEDGRADDRPDDHRDGVRARQGRWSRDICRPEADPHASVAVEAPRYWAQVMERADAVVAAVHRCDASGARYLTGVAARLLEHAAERDLAIESAYRTPTEVA